jgi:lysophospholipase L1-like esterase
MNIFSTLISSGFRFWRQAFLLVSLGLVPLAAQTPGGVFRDGDRWLVVGDSITQNGTYYEWIYLYYATRFPDLKLDVFNCGISGDTAAGTLRRYPWDIKPRHGTVATVMLGMNDVSRDLYGAPNPTPGNLAQRQNALATYEKNMTDLVHLLQGDGARLVLLTPSPFDETVDLPDKPPLTGVNEVLGQCSDFVKKLGAEIGAQVVDLHGPMTELTRQKQATDPKFTTTGPDRIHPHAPGHLVIAYLFLKDTGAPGLVSEVDLDASGAKTTRVENATVTDLAASGGGLFFTSLEKALPFPILNDFKPALDWVPFQQDLNREMFSVTGLSAGAYSLFIDNQKIADFDATQLSGGVNLATFDSTPQARQAAQVAVLMQKWQKLMANGDRGISQVEHFMLKDLPHPITFEQARPRLEALLPTLDPKKDGYNISIIKRYLAVKPLQEQTQKDLANLAVSIRAAAQPQAHAYRLVPVSH